MKANRLLATAMAAAMTIGLMTGCGSSSGSSASDSSDGIAAGTYTYRQTLANADEVEIPPYNFGGDNILSNYLNAYSVELTLEDDGTFTLESRGWMTEDLDASGEEPAEYEYGTEYVGSADTALEVSVISYSDATTYNTYTQTIELTQENIEALQ